MATREDMPQPKRIETEVIARCAYCKQQLYVERFDEVHEDGQPVRSTHEQHGGFRCDCPGAQEARKKREQQ